MQIIHYFLKDKGLLALSMHYLICKFKKGSLDLNINPFLKYTESKISLTMCKEARKATVDQNSSYLWREMRYGRITASICSQAARCKTEDGVLIEQIFGASAIPETAAMSRGKILEEEVKSVVCKIRNVKIRRAVFF